VTPVRLAGVRADTQKDGPILVVVVGRSESRSRQMVAVCGMVFQMRTYRLSTNFPGAPGEVSFLATMKAGQSSLFAAGTTASTPSLWRFVKAGTGAYM
jgi:hypothetical protein